MHAAPAEEDNACHEDERHDHVQGTCRPIGKKIRQKSSWNADSVHDEEQVDRFLVINADDVSTKCTNLSSQSRN
jgi:hypothetical protein